MIVTEVKGAARVEADLAAMAQRLKTGRAQLHSVIGHRMAFTRIPQAIQTNADGWSAPSPWPRAYRSGGQPLLDTRRLSSAFAYKATEQSVTIGTNVKYARILQKGGVIRPRYRKWLLEPLSPPLSISEVRAFPSGKVAIRARYPDSFFLAKGPDGPGVYRPVRGKAGSRSRKYGDRRTGNQVTASWERHSYEGMTIERIAAASRSVRVRRYNMLRWRAADIADCKFHIVTWASTGRLPRVASSGGNPLGGPHA